MFAKVTTPISEVKGRWINFSNTIILLDYVNGIDEFYYVIAWK